MREASDQFLFMLPRSDLVIFSVILTIFERRRSIHLQAKKFYKIGPFKYKSMFTAKIIDDLFWVFLKNRLGVFKENNVLFFFPSARTY